MWYCTRIRKSEVDAGTELIFLLEMSAPGTKRALRSLHGMSAFGGKADMPLNGFRLA
jgi:hypothetical protein